MMLRPLAELSSFGVLRQALRQSSVSRRPSGNPTVQARWHIRLGQQNVGSLIQKERNNSWSAGPALGLKSLQDQGEITSKLQEACRAAGTKADNLEVVIHLASQCRSNIMRPPADLKIPREALLISAPEKIISENLADLKNNATWIDTPFSKPPPIALRCQRVVWEFMDAALANLSSSGLYSLTVTSAVLETTAIAQAISKLTTRNKSFLYWAQYDAFMTLISFNEAGEPLMLRAIEHVSDTFHPDLAQLIKEVILQSDIKEPGFGIVPCGASTSAECVEALTAAYQDKAAPLFDTGCLEVLDEAAFSEKVQASGAKGDTSGLKPEHLFWMESFWKGSDPKNLRQACSGNFHQLTPDRLVNIAPIAITRAVKLLIPALLLCCVALIAAALFLGYSYMQALQAPSWPIDQTMVTSRTATQTVLHKNLTNYQSIENLLVNRSSYAFSALFLNKLFPPNSGVTITEVRYEFHPTVTKGAVSCERIWTIDGETTQEAQASLVTTSDPENVSKLLTSIATDYGYPSFIPTKKQNVKVSVSNGNGNAPQSLNASDKKSLPFTMVVSLLLTDSDPMALKPAGK